MKPQEHIIYDRTGNQYMSNKIYSTGEINKNINIIKEYERMIADEFQFVQNKEILLRRIRK
jgi:hypothetical protein